ncbi:hypothetical protein RN001_001315 [Aquatica leii]|uniref:Uncharacterized protein n=1 Tax=Aquatica leii TaxID=1421715 RepID=A0AAN7SL57_9COLE|nr:hypothetical protein RN001_001315 [Aquatica leii]
MSLLSHFKFIFSYALGDAISKEKRATDYASSSDNESLYQDQENEVSEVVPNFNYLLNEEIHNTDTAADSSLQSTQSNETDRTLTPSVQPLLNNDFLNNIESKFNRILEGQAAIQTALEMLTNKIKKIENKEYQENDISEDTEDNINSLPIQTIEDLDKLETNLKENHNYRTVMEMKLPLSSKELKAKLEAIVAEKDDIDAVYIPPPVNVVTVEEDLDDNVLVDSRPPNDTTDSFKIYQPHQSETSLHQWQ